MSKKIAEKKLWKIVKEGLEKKEYGYICSDIEAKWKKLKEGFLSMGIGGIQADVIGFKDVGTARFPKLEVIAVEVKPDLPNYRQRHIDQAKRAALYAHKCFFAAPREFKAKEIEIAVNSGVGLFQIDVDNKKLKQITPSVPFDPDEAKVVRLMDRLGYFKCAICDCYWNRRAVPTGYRPKHYFSSKKSVRFYKFICGVCAQKIFKSLSPEFKMRYTEEWKIKRIIKRQEAIERRLKKFSLRADRGLKRKGNKLERQIKNIKKYLRERISQRHKKTIKEIRGLKRKLKSI